jgi:hypothetical protein
VLLFILPGPLKEVANVLLFLNMLGAVYVHFALKDGMDKMTPALIFGLLLGCRFIVHLQVRSREARQAKQKQATVAEKKTQ